MEQEIGFCTTSDGVSIAYATITDGEQPIVYANGWPTQLDAEWEAPQARGFLEALAEGCVLIRYDMRGTGLSEKGASEFSVPTLVKDLEAVVEHLNLSKFGLLCLGGLAGPIGMTYAAAHVARINRLILSSAYIRGDQLLNSERQKAQIDYVSKFGFPVPLEDDPDIDIEAQRDSQRRMEEAGPPEVLAALLGSIYSIDVSELLDQLTMPTLVIHARKDEVIPFAQGRELAARLPHAKFVSLEGSSPTALAYQEIRLAEIRSFLGLHVKPHSEPSGDTHTILFTDMEGSTALTQSLGDKRAQEIRGAHNDIVRTALSSNEGNEIKHTGDGIMASFATASRALQCAIAIQQGVAAHKEEHPDSPLGVYVGLNAGEPIAEDDDLFGTSVDLAARLVDHAQPGQIIASDVVRQLAAGKDFLFADLGETELRGFEDPVKLWEVRWQESD